MKPELPCWPLPPGTETFTPLPEAVSLRDHFAAAALQGMLASDSMIESRLEMARFAYELADAMLAERQRHG